MYVYVNPCDAKCIIYFISSSIKNVVATTPDTCLVVFAQHAKMKNEEKSLSSAKSLITIMSALPL